MGTTGSASVTLNTQALYEEIGFSEQAVNNLASGYFYIEGTLLVYNEQGALVGKYVEAANDFQPIHFRVGDLPNGVYTIVAAQLGRQQDFSPWEIVAEENLSTVQIRRLNEHTYWPFAVGLASQQLTVLGGEAEASLTPQSAGSIVEVMIARTESFTPWLKIWGDKMPTGLYLNPQLNADERLAYDESNTWGSICLVDRSVTKTAYFTIGRGSQHVQVETYFPADAKWTVLWWGQQMTLSTAPHAMFCYDSYPQLMYKAFVGSRTDYGAWAAAHNANGLKLEPLMDYGLSVDDFDRVVTGSPWFCSPQNSELKPLFNRWTKHYAIWPDGQFGITCVFETEDGKNASEFIYQYNGADISAELMHEQILSWGYEYKGYFYATNDNTIKSSVFLKPNGVDEIQLWQPADNAYWQLSFHKYDQEDFDLLIAE